LKTRKLSTLLVLILQRGAGVDLRKSRDIKSLFEGGSARLTSLLHRSRARSAVLTHVQAALPLDLARTVATAGLEQGCLTLGVAGAVWASRLRYATGALCEKVGQSMGVEIQRVRIRVVQPGP
jgi:hypothetical protein